MKKIILSIYILIIVSSCNEKTQDKIGDEAMEFINQISFYNYISESDEINIELYDSTVTHNSSRSVESFKPKKAYRVVEKQIDNFEDLFEDSEKTDYCCCPTANYSISFMKNNKELDVFYVDSIEFKDRIRVYEGSFQYSYIIEKQKWKKFLSEVKN